MNNKQNSFYKLLAIILIIFNILLVFVLISSFTSDISSTDNSLNETTNNQMADEKNIVLVETTYGNFKIELFLEKSPITAGNFRDLVEKGFYDGTKFHRVIKDFMIQGGDPLSKNDTMTRAWGTGGPGYAIKDEFIKGLSNKRGTLSMANSGPNSGGSQFFINVVNNTFLDWDKEPFNSKHPVFGKVIEGMEIVDKIVNTKTVPGDRPAENIEIIKATLVAE